MVAGSTLGTLVIAAAASLFMAWAIGAGSSGSTPFAPAVGANAISVMRAGFFVGILGLLGAVLQGANVTETVGSGLILFPDGGGLSAIAATIALLTAAVLVAIGVFAGYPIATAFTVTGAVVGVGLAMGGQPAWPKYQQIALLWVLTPFAGSFVGFLTAKLLRADRIAERFSIAGLAGLVGVLLANVEFTGLGPDGGPGALSVALARTFEGGTGGRALVSLVLGLLIAAAVWYDVHEHGERAQRRFLLVMGGLVAFSAGGSQVGLAIGPLLPLLDTFTVPITAVLLGGGIGLLAGSWTGAPRMIKALSQDYSSLGPRRSIAALIPSFMIAQTAVYVGLPVSFNEIIVFSIIGSGAAAGGGSVSGEKMGKTVLAWVASLALALGLGYGVFTAVSIL
ncbi:anion permease [Halomicrobium sp. IBSBa]|uniref:inorganic phosphate transporter n=1 Tax=Halomicrobium sp. IBSBa TaxID=2778916 RepID=UPI001ABF9B3B|nr:inorganic phosphate transporter [Halomicrobium sp. IBSBa]MBO4247589.1 anion permease [Halomicrobium sp. IBSBa]